VEEKKREKEKKISGSRAPVQNKPSWAKKATDQKPSWVKHSSPSEVAKQAKPTKKETIGNVLPEWEKDEVVDACHGCKTGFSFFCRRHHCRRCGLIFCDDCSGHEIELEKLFDDHEKRRVCNDCYKAKGSPEEKHGWVS